MGYRPPKGVPPPQLEGRRTGRRKGTRNHAQVWADIEWACDHRYDASAVPPNPTALHWWRLARSFPDVFAYWVENDGRVVDEDAYYDGY